MSQPDLTSKIEDYDKVTRLGDSTEKSLERKLQKMTADRRKGFNYIKRVFQELRDIIDTQEALVKKQFAADNFDHDIETNGKTRLDLLGSKKKLNSNLKSLSDLLTGKRDDDEEGADKNRSQASITEECDGLCQKITTLSKTDKETQVKDVPALKALQTLADAGQNAIFFQKFAVSIHEGLLGKELAQYNQPASTLNGENGQLQVVDDEERKAIQRMKKIGKWEDTPLKNLVFFRQNTRWVYIYYIKDECWANIRLLVDFLLPPGHKTVLLPNGYAYMVGGDRDKSFTDVFMYDTSQTYNTTLIRRQSSLYGHAFHSLVHVGKYLYALGGSRDQYKKCERYDILRDEWEPIADMLNGRYFHSACNVGNKFIYAFGGCDGEGNITSSQKLIERYDISLDKWETVKFSGYSAWNGSSLSGVYPVSENEILIFGGIDSATSSPSKEVYYFNTKERECYRSEFQLPEESDFITCIPYARFSRKRAVGGEDDGAFQLYANDDESNVYVYNSKEKDWRLLDVKMNMTPIHTEKGGCEKCCEFN